MSSALRGQRSRRRAAWASATSRLRRAAARHLSVVQEPFIVTHDGLGLTIAESDAGGRHCGTALDKWAKADPNRMTREEALAENRKGQGPPYRMTIELPAPVLTEEEEAEALAQAEYEDDMGIERDPETYTILRAQNPEDAKREAEELRDLASELDQSAHSAG